MKRLAPNLFQRRFQDLMEIGRARLSSVAPEWTDHNAHDPGITLMELLAWVAEAQLYAVSRMRRDERRAFAALLGISPHGTQGASGLIWPDRLDPNSPAYTFAKSVVLAEDARIQTTDGKSAAFAPLGALLVTPGRIERLEWRDARGRKTDYTATNAHGDLPFLPFGPHAGRRDVLAMMFECRDKAGLFGENWQRAKGALWPVGVLAAPPTGGGVAPAASARTDRSPLGAALVTEDDRFELSVALDFTQELLTTGAILLNLDNVTTSPRRFTVELRSANGLPRPPRVLRIEPNVVPVLQGRRIWRELHEPVELPDWTFSLGTPGLRFASDQSDPITLEVAEPSGVKAWRRCERLSEQGPNDDVYELDEQAGQVTFGNGVNGRIPPLHSQVFVTYAVSDGEQGDVARNRKWKVEGFQGTFGVNPDPFKGGSGSSGLVEERREARRRCRDEHALVSSADMVAAAKALPLLEVAEAWVPAPDPRAPSTGVVTLVALRSRPAGDEPDQPPETAQWLEAIRRRLATRMPLGSRLVVAAPRYVPFTLRAVLEVQIGRNPLEVRSDVKKELKKRLAPTIPGMSAKARQPGIPVTLRDIGAWMRAIDGVKSVIQLQLRRADGTVDTLITIPRNGLPKWDDTGSTIEVKRPEPGRPR